MYGAWLGRTRVLATVWAALDCVCLAMTVFLQVFGYGLWLATVGVFSLLATYCASILSLFFSTVIYVRV